MTTIAHYFSCHRFRGRWVWFVVRKSWLDAELIDVFWGSLVNREFRPFALKLCCFNLMCRWSTISFDSSSALTRLDSSWYIFFFCLFFYFFSFLLGTPGEYDAVYDSFILFLANLSFSLLLFCLYCFLFEI